MRIIHCADLHLDSKLSANLDSEKRKERKAELLKTFERMVSYAKDNNVRAIIIAGDLFDTNTISKTAGNTVYYNIVNNPEIDFYYLKGNHDANDYFASMEVSMEAKPHNLKLFSDELTSYTINPEGTVKVVITATELNGINSNTIYNALSLNARDFNIVTLHGQHVDYNVKDKAEVIHINGLKNKGIDYLALGHIHAYMRGNIDARGVYCYPGCLEGRGFDECGEHGFVLLNIDEENGQFTDTFIPFAKRNIYTVEVDVTDAGNSNDMTDRVRKVLNDKKYSSDSMIKIVLTGSLFVECEINTDFILNHFIQDYYFVKLYDETKLKIDYTQYEHDASLKGEFIRLVRADDTMDEDMKNEIIRMGIRALSGEEITV